MSITGHVYLNCGHLEFIGFGRPSCLNSVRQYYDPMHARLIRFSKFDFLNLTFHFRFHFLLHFRFHLTFLFRFHSTFFFRFHFTFHFHFPSLQVVENSVFAFTQPAPLWRHVVVTVTIIVLSVGASMATDCLGFVLELNVSLNG